MTSLWFMLFAVKYVIFLSQKSPPRLASKVFQIIQNHIHTYLALVWCTGRKGRKGSSCFLSVCYADTEAAHREGPSYLCVTQLWSALSAQWLHRLCAQVYSFLKQKEICAKRSDFKLQNFRQKFLCDILDCPIVTNQSFFSALTLMLYKPVSTGGDDSVLKWSRETGSWTGARWKTISCRGRDS